MTIKWVSSDPLVMNGEPFCYGTRLTVRNLLEMRSNGEGKPHIHPARVEFNWLINVFTDISKRQDFIYIFVNILPWQSHDRAAQIDVLAAGKLGVEASSKFQQC